LFLSLLLFFAFLVCASMHKVAQARALGLSTRGSSQAHDADQTALLNQQSAAPQCADHHAAPDSFRSRAQGHASTNELAAIEIEDTELDARVDTVVAAFAVTVAHVGPAIGQAPLVVAEAATDKFWVSSALPRGPPDTHR
jgi:hypothetical protein